MDTLLSAGWTIQLIHQISEEETRRRTFWDRRQVGFSFLGDKLLYFANHQDSTVSMVHGGEQGKPYRHIDQLSFADGKLLFVASTWQTNGRFYVSGTKEKFVVHGALEGVRYPEIADLQFADGKPLYRVTKGGTSTYLVHNTKEAVKSFIEAVVKAGLQYHSHDVGSETMRNFEVSNRKELIVYGTKEGKEYDAIHGLTAVDGKPFYQAKEGGEWLVVHGTEEMEQLPSQQEMLPHLNRKLPSPESEGEAPYQVRPASYCGCCREIWYNDENIFTVHGKFKFLQLVDGKPLFLIDEGSSQYVVHGAERGITFHNVEDLIIANKKPLYIALSQEGYYSIVHGNAMSKLYNQISNATVTDKEIYYIARWDSQILKVSLPLTT